MKETGEERLRVQVRQQTTQQRRSSTGVVDVVVGVGAQLFDADVDDRLAIGVVAVGSH